MSRSARDPRPVGARANPATLSDQAMSSMISERDIDLERERIHGISVEDRMRRLLALADQDLERLSMGEWLTLGAQVLALIEVSASEKRVGAAFYVGPPSLREMQEALRAVVANLIAHKRIELPSRDFFIWERPSGEAPDETRGRIVLTRFQKTSGLVPVILVIFRDLLERVTQLGRLRSCLECGGLFVSTRRQLRHPVCAKAQRVRERQEVRDKQRKRPKKGA